MKISYYIVNKKYFDITNRKLYMSYIFLIIICFSSCTFYEKQIKNDGASRIDSSKINTLDTVGIPNEMVSTGKQINSFHNCDYDSMVFVIRDSLIIRDSRRFNEFIGAYNISSDLEIGDLRKTIYLANIENSEYLMCNFLPEDSIDNGPSSFIIRYFDSQTISIRKKAKKLPSLNRFITGKGFYLGMDFYEFNKILFERNLDKIYVINPVYLETGILEKQVGCVWFEENCKLVGQLRWSSFSERYTFINDKLNSIEIGILPP